MNFYISNYKDNIGRIYDGESWVIKDGDQKSTQNKVK